MKKLFEQINNKYDQSEIYYSSVESVSVSIANGKLDGIETKKEGGYSVRTFKDGVMGFAYSNKIDDVKPILESHDISLMGKVEADVDLPGKEDLPELDTYDSAIENIDSAFMNEKCDSMYKFIKDRVEAEISTYSWKGVFEQKLINSKGIDYSEKKSYSGMYGSIDYPGGGGSLSKMFQSKGAPDYCEKELEDLIELYKIGQNIVTPKGGKMKVLFMPSSVYALIWRLYVAAQADSVDQGISVLKDKIGEKIFSDKITIYNDPLDDKYPGAQAFDGEGVVNKRNNIVDKGEFKSFYGNLKFCKKIGIEPTGGSNRGSWSSQPSSSIGNLHLEPGNLSFDELVSQMDKGIIVFGVLGAHSGNIPNGDLSIGINPCFYVENGKIQGRVKDAMLACNVYDAMKNVVAIGNKSEPGTMINTPPILLDDMNVSIK